MPATKVWKTLYFEISGNPRFSIEIIGTSIEILGFSFEILGISKLCDNRIPYRHHQSLPFILLITLWSDNASALIFCRFLSLLMRIYATKFEVNITSHSQDTTKKSFQRQMMVPVDRQTLLRNTSMEGKYFIFFLQRKMLTNALLTCKNNLIRCY